MPPFDLPDGVRSSLHEQLRTHGLLEAAISGRDRLKVAAAMTAFAAIFLATVTSYATSIVDEPGATTQGRSELP
jgi:hypothetical protein